MSLLFDFHPTLNRQKKPYYYSSQRVGGTPTVPWVMAYRPSMGFHKICHLAMMIETCSHVVRTVHIATFFVCM